ncbi:MULTISPECIES: hypothetical protein [Kitasatospora]|uniref:hypothetical protein n=1 Tax=Kitasatospora TaxID=2063 RepID=UPI001E3ABE92|nr:MULTISPECIES: hypothetical protein [Kitasatospora]
MSLRERVDLAAVLYGVPRPDGESSRSFPFDKHTAPAVGLSSSTLWRVRSVIHKSQEEAISSDADIDRARKILRLMVEAYECPPSGWKSYSAIEYLHSLLQVGDIPDRLDQLDKPKGTGGDAVKDLPAREETRSPESIPGPRRQLVDIRRGIDSIAGVCAGLAAVSELCPLTAAERAQLGADIRRSKKVLSRIQSML